MNTKLPHAKIFDVGCEDNLPGILVGLLPRVADSDIRVDEDDTSSLKRLTG